jgi:hypothetical protein
MLNLIPPLSIEQIRDHVAQTVALFMALYGAKMTMS